jgi:hypothetical protein
MRPLPSGLFSHTPVLWIPVTWGLARMFILVMPSLGVMALAPVLGWPDLQLRGQTTQAPMSLSIHGGGTIALGHVADIHTSGFHLGSGLALRISPRVEVEGAAGVHRLGRDDAATLVRIGIPEAEQGRFWAGGGFLDGGHRSLLMLGANLRFLPLLGSGRVSPYLLAGGGLVRESLAETDSAYLGEWESHDGTSGVGGYLTMGAGVRVSLSPSVALFGQGGYLLSTVEEDRTSTAPLQLGLSFGIGEP